MNNLHFIQLNGLKIYLSRLSLLLLPVLILLPFLSMFPYPGSGGEYTDIAISHFPNAIYLRRAILEFHTVPLWSPTILSGYPFFANPLSGLWYPPGWFAVLFPLPLGFNLLIVLHLLWGGTGVYKLLRTEDRSVMAALFGGIAFTALPKIFAHYGAGHLTLIYAVSWTPWLLLASRYEADSVQSLPYVKLWKAAGARTGIILSLIAVADVRWFAYAGVLFVLYVFFHNPLVSEDYKVKHFNDRVRRRLFQSSRSLVRISAAGFYTGLLTAPLLLPLLQYARISTRSNMSLQDVFTYSLPYERLLGLVYPDFGGFHEFMIYPGAVVLVLAFLALLWGGVSVNGRFWGLLAFLSILYSIGNGLPGMQVLAKVPGMNLMRVPSRALFITGLALIAFAAYGMDRLISGPSKSEVHRSNLGLAGLGLSVLALTITFSTITSSLATSLAWGGGMLFVCTLWMRKSVFRLVDRKYWYAGLLGIALVDWWAIDYSLFTPKPPGVVMAEASTVAEQISLEEDIFRVYSPSYSLPQQTAAFYNLELSDGIDPLQLTSYRDYLLRAVGITKDEAYSVTLPPFPSGDPQIDNREFVPNLDLLGFLNVKYIVSSFEIRFKSDVKEILRTKDVHVYINPKLRPRAWVQEDMTSPAAEMTPVSDLNWEPNRIEIKASGPGTLVLSEIAYPGWQVYVDGQPAEILTIEEILRGVEIPAEAHNILFVFRPRSLYIGVFAMTCGLVILILNLWFRKNLQR